MLSYNETTEKYYWNAKEITKDEYNRIREIIRNKPQAPEGKDYRLNDNLEWELYDLPPAEPLPEGLETRVTRLEQDMADIQTAYQEGVNHA